MSTSPRRAPGSVAPLMVLVSLISVLAAPAARADGVRDTRRVTEGTLLVRTAESEALVPAPVLKTDVHMVVSGIVARATVSQEFTNPTSRWSEGIYVFPLPEDAAVDHTSLVAVDVTPVRPDGEALHGRALATNLPGGWDYTAVLGLGQGATAGPVHLAVGLLALLLAAALGIAVVRATSA